MKRFIIAVAGALALMGAGPASQPADQYPALQKRLASLASENAELKTKVSEQSQEIEQLKKIIADVKPKQMTDAKHWPWTNLKIGMSKAEALALFDESIFASDLVSETGGYQTINVSMWGRKSQRPGFAKKELFYRLTFDTSKSALMSFDKVLDESEIVWPAKK